MALDKIKNTLGRSGYFSIALVYAATLSAGLVFALNQGKVEAAGHLEPRSLKISSSASGDVNTDTAGNAVPAGAPGNGAKTSETFTFTPPSSTDVAGIQFLYCTTPLPGTTCVPPKGMDVSTVTSVYDTPSAPAAKSGWTVDTTNTTNGTQSSDGSGGVTVNGQDKISIQQTTPTGIGGSPITFIFGNGDGGSTTDYIKNPTGPNTQYDPNDNTFFVRITTYSTVSSGTYSGVVDRGTVASSIAQQVNVTAKVEETLGFSVGVPSQDDDTSKVTPVPAVTGTQCKPLTDANDGAIKLGQVPDGVLSFNKAFLSHSYFRIHTNATDGTDVEYAAKTLTSGSDTIDPIGTKAGTVGSPVISKPGTEQFGIAIDQTQADADAGTPAHGNDLTSLVPEDAYDHDQTDTANGSNLSDEWAFQPSTDTTPTNVLATTKNNAGENKIIKCDTGAVSYLGNIATTTAAGIYTSTFTYIAVPEY